MIDPRFHEAKGPLSLGRLAEVAGVALDPVHAGVVIATCGPLDAVGADGLAFCEKPPREGGVSTRAGACFVRPRDVAALPEGVVALATANPRAAFSKACALLYVLRRHPSGAPAVHPDARLEDGVHLGPNVVVGPGAEIGAGTTIGAGSVIGPGVAIGRDCEIGHLVSIRCALIGDRVRIASGSIIGDAGFGVAPTADGPVDVPQLGRVILQDDVTLGSLVAVDRGAFGDTVVGLSAKIDNFTQIAHNVTVGRGVVIAAFGGVSGSTTLGDHVMMGGRVGTADHLVIGERAHIAAGSGVLDDVPPGETWGGYPAKPRAAWVREMVALRRLVGAGKAGANKKDGGEA
jgi:UDP-3-O-[3-hydroxymyristoyl] glucosamine N-acyltransferase